VEGVDAEDPDGGEEDVAVVKGVSAGAAAGDMVAANCNMLSYVNRMLKA
jgi:hypothetical protein